MLRCFVMIGQIHHLNFRVPSGTISTSGQVKSIEATEGQPRERAKGGGAGGERPERSGAIAGGGF